VLVRALDDAEYHQTARAILRGAGLLP
jgi:hypothetical protein